MSAEFVATSIARRLMARMRASHERRRIAVFAGPPGVGKTTAVDALARELEESVVVVKVARRNAREILVLQHVYEVVRQLRAARPLQFPGGSWELRNNIFSAICAWAGVDPHVVRRGECAAQAFPRLTIVFDEAQNLSRGAIESLRYWNDADRCYAPFPLGLIFIGNNEFSLQTDLDGRSVISAAVADRALYVQTLDYSDVTDDDVRLYLKANGIVDADAAAAIMSHIEAARLSRSFRRIEDLLAEIRDSCAARPVTAALVRDALAFT